ncbi:MAG TPA: glucan 1,4-alpha-glucosidase [Micromonosporaceae bacterium]|nr:glucan 1,4-alpha-glucosidase [Micromonosporaceae bacterium]
MVERRITRRRGRTALLAATALVAAGLSVPGSAAAAISTAPGAPGGPSSWTTGAKQGVGTSTTGASKVWYTLAEGVLTEIYYPRVDVADVQDLQLIVTDGSSFTDLERDATTHRVELADPRALIYRQVNTDKDHRYRITKTYATDPERSTVLIDVRVDSLDGGTYMAYVLYNPSLANSGRHDSASSTGSALVADDTSGATPVASALVAKPAFSRVSNGFSGVSDGWTDLRADHRMDWTYTVAADGNVVQVGQLSTSGRGGPIKATLALGFASTDADALRTATASLRRAFPAVRDAYAAGWHAYLESLAGAPASVSGDLRTQYDVAVMTLKAHEDKTYSGANIASLTVPWGQAVNADEAGVGGYHLVWARDLYQEATAMLAAGDRAAAERSLDYLFDVQQKPDGSFPQNSLLDGTPYWGGLQLDEVAYPIVLAGQLDRHDAGTWQHVKKAADFIVGHGPATPQERWEEEGGFSPSTIAAEIAGLVIAADIARRNGDDASAALYTGVADDWQRKVAGWTFTTTGPIGDGRYFERIDDNGNPNDGHILDINNGGGSYDERSIVDAGFLDLVRLGVTPADDPHVAASLAEVDATIKVDTPNGPMWYRYNHDGYGEKADGNPYDGTGVGRLWPLLTGERGEYELAAGRDAAVHLRTMAAAGNEGYMIPEQVWERPDAYGFRFGEGTGSATPLAWSMAQYVRLAHSIDAGRPVETPALVAARYAGGAIPAGPALAVTSPAEGTTTNQGTITVSGTTDAVRVYVNVAGQTSQVAVTDGSFSASVPLSLGRNTITVVAVGANGGTSVVQRTVTSTNFGTAVGTVDDPAGDDNGRGTYVYPAAGEFTAGVFDLTRFGVYDDGVNVNFVVTLAGEVRNPWGGNQISVQRFNVYVRGGAGTGTVDALPGTNARLAAPYDLVVTGDGFNDLGVRDAAGNAVGPAALLALPATRQIIASVPKSVLGSTNLSTAQYAVVMMSHAGDGEGTGHVRPVYDRAYWESTAGTDMWWIHDYRFGGGAGVWTGDTDARDTVTADPNVIDVIVPPGVTQAQVLDWTTASPVTLRYVSLG